MFENDRMKYSNEEGRCKVDGDFFYVFVFIAVISQQL